MVPPEEAHRGLGHGLESVVWVFDLPRHHHEIEELGEEVGAGALGGCHRPLEYGTEAPGQAPPERAGSSTRLRSIARSEGSNRQRSGP